MEYLTRQQIRDELSRLRSTKPLVTPRKDGKYDNLINSIYYHTDFLPDEILLSLRIKYIQEDRYEIKKCKCGCGKPVKKHENDYIRGHCNRDNNVKEKKKESYRKNYGCDNPSQSEEVKKKKEQSSIKNYGTESHMKSEVGKKEYRRKIREKHGVDNVFQLDSVKEKVMQKFEENKHSILKKREESQRRNFYRELWNNRLQNKFEPLFTEEEYIGVDKKYPFKCLNCGNTVYSTIDNGLIPRCYDCFPVINQRFSSVLEKQISDYLKSLDIKVSIHERKVIPPYEVDFYLPDYNIAIEFDGLYWHSEINGEKPRNYHRYKSELIEKQSITPIHIFEDEWVHKTEVVKSRLKDILNKNSCRVHARKCTIREINNSLKNRFLEKYHLQGKDRSSVKLGAFYGKRLVAVMTFCSRRIALGGNPEENCYELSRFCCMKGVTVQGIAGKLLSYFENNYQPRKIVSYADRRWSTGELYKNTGFSFSHYTEPNYWYIDKNMRRIYRFNFRKDVLSKKLDNYDPEKSEWENMKSNGYDRIWDCGNMVFVKEY